MAPMTRPARACGAALLLWALSLWACAADPVAFLADVRGEVTLNGGARAPFLAELQPGARLTLGAGATAAVMYVVSGDEFALKGPGEYALAPDGVRAEKGPPPARRASAVRPSSAVLVKTSRAATASLRMRGGAAAKPEPAGLRYPVDARVSTLQPTLRWDVTPGASVLVEVTEADGKVVFKGRSKGPSLRLPVRLEPGRAYAWRCLDDGRAVGTARFETLAAEAVEAAERARGDAKGFTDRVALALLLQDLGAAQDARELWIQLSAERPDLPELAVLAR
jgi:hypothetical protein